MKTFIKYDDKNYIKITLIIFALILSIFFGISFSKINLTGKIIICILIISIILLTFNVFKLGITFDYRKKIIKSYVPILSDCYKIKMKDIKYIQLIEISKKRKKRFFSTFTKIEASQGIQSEPDYIYRNGKMFNLDIIMKDGSTKSIFYGILYKSRSKERVKKQEDKINNAINEFNKYRMKNKSF